MVHYTIDHIEKIKRSRMYALDNSWYKNPVIIPYDRFQEILENAFLAGVSYAEDELNYQIQAKTTHGYECQGDCYLYAQSDRCGIECPIYLAEQCAIADEIEEQSKDK